MSQWFYLLAQRCAAIKNNSTRILVSSLEIYGRKMDPHYCKVIKHACKLNACKLNTPHPLQVKAIHMTFTFYKNHKYTPKNALQHSCHPYFWQSNCMKSWCWSEIYKSETRMSECKWMQQEITLPRLHKRTQGCSDITQLQLAVSAVGSNSVFSLFLCLSQTHFLLSPSSGGTHCTRQYIISIELFHSSSLKLWRSSLVSLKPQTI